MISGACQRPVVAQGPERGGVSALATTNFFKKGM